MPTNVLDRHLRHCIESEAVKENKPASQSLCVLGSHASTCQERVRCLGEFYFLAAVWPTTTDPRAAQVMSTLTPSAAKVSEKGGAFFLPEKGEHPMYSQFRTLSEELKSNCGKIVVKRRPA